MGKFQDLTGQHFGRLVVDHRITSKKSNTVLWKCKCDCGNSTDVNASNLRNGCTRSCGCLNAEARAKRFRLRPYENTYNRLCAAARARNIPNTLTYKDYVTFTNKKLCHYCHTVLKWAKWGNKNTKQRHNLDRKNNDLGYTVSNCVQCCPRCNRSKSNSWSYAEWRKMTKWFREKNVRS